MDMVFLPYSWQAHDLTFSISSDQAERRLSDMSDLHRIWASEFGNPFEVAARVLVMIAAGYGIWAYSGWWSGPIWVLGYLAATMLIYFTLRPSNPDHPAAWAFGVGSFFLSTAVFISFPLYAIAMGDAVLQFCGAMGVITFCVFSLYREETPSILQPFDIALGWTAIFVVAATFIPDQTSFAAEAVMVLLCAVAGGYYTLALIVTRSTQAELRNTVQRHLTTREMEAVGRLSGGIAHDFNNILTVLQGSLELYHVVPPGPERDILVEEAHEASQRASTLVSQLLAFARRAPLDPRALEATKLLSEIAGQSRALLPDGVSLEIRTLQHSAYVLADPDGIRAALMNLLRNALDAIGSRGTVTLAVDLCKGSAQVANCIPANDPAGAHLRFSVADDGPGMTPEVQGRALEPFFTTKPVGKGSGLGLSMVLGFAAQSGGALQIQSSDDGTIVSIHMPIADAHP